MGIFHVLLPVGYFSAFSPCLDCCVWSGGLWFLFNVEVSPSGWGWTIGLSKFLVREACIGVLVHGTGFLLSGVQWSVQE